ncbi:MAG: hypothetical protein HOJ57_28675 [Lentisphaerae bacterium]|jgi:hypothetical protein|nr:hypothetical protein [Lentisphaerota bacterium]MBT5609948.1 hypothetical protein [Lentisphaerota bacterium]
MTPETQSRTDCSQSYATMGIVALVEAIVSYSDRNALGELLGRTAFRSLDSQQLAMPEFLGLLTWSAKRRFGDRIAEAARDLTADKFSRFPDSLEDMPAHRRQHARHGGPDCRKCYAAFLRDIAAEETAMKPSCPIENEILAANRLQGLVSRQFWLSCLESRRTQDETRSRYDWSVNGGVLHLTMPRFLVGQERRRWLEANVPNVDPERPGERERAQEAIDRHWGTKQIFSLDAPGVPLPEEASVEPDLPWSFFYGLSEENLARVVAQEKADRISEQRPAIRALGKTRLIDLITTVFAELADGNSSDRELAQRAGLSPSTFSRFCGRNWRGNNGNGRAYSTPDLFVNTARVLGATPSFREAALAAGVWDGVKAICDAQE